MVGVEKWRLTLPLSWLLYVLRLYMWWGLFIIIVSFFSVNVQSMYVISRSSQNIASLRVLVSVGLESEGGVELYHLYHLSGENVVVYMLYARVVL